MEPSKQARVDHTVKALDRARWLVAESFEHEGFPADVELEAERRQRRERITDFGFDGPRVFDGQVIYLVDEP